MHWFPKHFTQGNQVNQAFSIITKKRNVPFKCLTSGISRNLQDSELVPFYQKALWIIDFNIFMSFFLYFLSSFWLYQYIKHYHVCPCVHFSKMVLIKTSWVRMCVLGGLLHMFVFVTLKCFSLYQALTVCLASLDLFVLWTWSLRRMRNYKFKATLSLSSSLCLCAFPIIEEQLESLNDINTFALSWKKKRIKGLIFSLKSSHFFFNM